MSGITKNKKISNIEKFKPDNNRMFIQGLAPTTGRSGSLSRKVKVQTRPAPEKCITVHDKYGIIKLEYYDYTHNIGNNTYGKIKFNFIPNFSWNDNYYWEYDIIKQSNGDVVKYERNILKIVEKGPFLIGTDLPNQDLSVIINIYENKNDDTTLCKLTKNGMIGHVYVVDDKYLLNKQLFFSKAIYAYNRSQEEELSLEPWYGASNPTGLNINIGVMDDGIVDRHNDFNGTVVNAIDWPWFIVNEEGGEFPYTNSFRYENILNNGHLDNIVNGGANIPGYSHYNYNDSIAWTQTNGAWFRASTMTNAGDNNVIMFGGVDTGMVHFKGLENSHFNKNLWKFTYDENTPDNSTWTRYDNPDLGVNCILPDGITEGTGSVYINNKFTIFGGSHSISNLVLNEDMSFSGQFCEFNLTKNLWIQKDFTVEPVLIREQDTSGNITTVSKTSNPEPRAYHKMAPIFDSEGIQNASKFVMFGGITIDEADFFHNVDDNGTWIYDSTKNSWLQLPNHIYDPSGRYLHSMSPVGDNKVIMMGGYTPEQCEFEDRHLESENNLLDTSVTFIKSKYYTDNGKPGEGSVWTCGTNGTLKVSIYFSDIMHPSRLTLKNQVGYIIPVGTVVQQYSAIDALFGISVPIVQGVLAVETKVTDTEIIVKDVSGNWFKPPGDLYDSSGTILTQLNIFINGFDFGPLNHVENDCVQQNIDQDMVGDHWYDVSGCRSSSNFQMDVTDKNTHLNSVSAWDPSSNWTGKHPAAAYVAGDDDYLHRVIFVNGDNLNDPSDNYTFDISAVDVSPFRNPSTTLKFSTNKNFVKGTEVYQGGFYMGFVKYSTKNHQQVIIDLDNDEYVNINLLFDVIIDDVNVGIPIESVYRYDGGYPGGSFINSNFDFDETYEYGGDIHCSKSNSKYGAKRNYIGNVWTFKRTYGVGMGWGVRGTPMRGSGKYLFISGAGKSLYRSGDGGETWDKLLHWGISDIGWGEGIYDPSGVGGRYRHDDQFITTIDCSGSPDLGVNEGLGANLYGSYSPVWVAGTGGLLGMGLNHGSGPWYWINPLALDKGTIWHTRQNNAYLGTPLQTDVNGQQVNQVPLYVPIPAQIDASGNDFAAEPNPVYRPQQVIGMDNVIIRIRDFLQILDENGMIKDNIYDNSWNSMPSKGGVALAFCPAGGGPPGFNNVAMNSYIWQNSQDMLVAHWSPKKDSSFINHYIYFMETGVNNSMEQRHFFDHEEIQRRTVPNDSLGPDILAIDDNGMPFNIFSQDHAGEIWAVGGAWIPKEPEAVVMTLTSKGEFLDAKNFADKKGAHTWLFTYDPIVPSMSYWMNLTTFVFQENIIFLQSNVPAGAPLTPQGGGVGYLMYQPDSGSRAYIDEVSIIYADDDTNQTTPYYKIIAKCIVGKIDSTLENSTMYIMNNTTSQGTISDISWNIGLPDVTQYPVNSNDPTKYFSPVNQPKGVSPYNTYIDNTKFTYYEDGRPETRTDTLYPSTFSENETIEWKKNNEAKYENLEPSLGALFDCSTNFCNSSMAYLQDNKVLMYGGVKGIFPAKGIYKVEELNDAVFFSFQNPVPKSTRIVFEYGGDVILENDWPANTDFSGNITQLVPPIHLPSWTGLTPTWYIYRAGTFESFIFNYDSTNFGRSSNWEYLNNNNGPSSPPNNTDPPYFLGGDFYAETIDKPGFGAYLYKGHRYGHEMAHIKENKVVCWGGISYDTDAQNNGFTTVTSPHFGGTKPINNGYDGESNTFTSIKPKVTKNYLKDDFGRIHGAYTSDQHMGWTTDTYVFNYDSTTPSNSTWTRLNIDRPGDEVNAGDSYLPGNGATHGTSVASIIGSKKNNGYSLSQKAYFNDSNTLTHSSNTGTYGVAHNSNIISYRAWDNSGNWPRPLSGVDFRETSQFSSDIINRNIKIINNSWGFMTFSTGFPYKGWFVNKKGNANEYNKIYKNYIQQAKSGVINVCAAGNSSDSESNLLAGTPLYVPEVSGCWVNVVSLDVSGGQDLWETYYTNRAGCCWPWTISALGGSGVTDGGVISASNYKGISDHDGNTLPGYRRVQGTSMAAPLVSGALAIIAERFPNLSSEECVDRLFQTASGRIGQHVAGRKSSTLTPNIEKRYYQGGLVDPSKNSPDNTTFPLSVVDISGIFGWGFLDLEAATSPMTKSDYEDLKLFGKARRDYIVSEMIETLKTDKGAKYLTGLSSDISGSVRLIYPSPATAPPDGLGRRRRRRRRNGRRRRRRGRRNGRRRRRRGRKRRRPRRRRGRRRPRRRKRKRRRGRRYSDIRLKNNVHKIGNSPSGIPIYTFCYNYDKTNIKYRGTIAQDLIDMNKEDCVFIAEDGHYVVDYDMIDVTYVRV